MSLDLERARDDLRRYIAEYERARIEAGALQRKVEGLRRIIDGIEMLYPVLRQERTQPPELPDAVVRRRRERVAERLVAARAPELTTDEWASITVERDDGPRGSEAVVRVLREFPRRPFTVKQMTREILQRGWAPEGSSDPEAAVRASLNRAAGSVFGVIKRPDDASGQVVYLYSPPNVAAIETRRDE